MSFPAPGDSSLDTSLDLNGLVKNPAATFFMRVEGEGLLNECVHPGDLLIVDRSIDAVAGKLVVAAVDGALVIRKLQIVNGQLRLQEPDASAKASGDFEVWGVVTTIIHSL
ncbi:DNA polymerase V [Oscillatoria sp. FACHB-1407]|uniref:LexA family protein n=1 Tax=Oscillatoria sp. FACHB-1407 TaxID=2692847 RepID=UPI0016841541|nr:S24 family peptidase [Oscillatoria sp. FACHB-1407]MBD2465730.1 DNA polymerase V [Oscillatoria sp. FACHB-1407]